MPVYSKIDNDFPRLDPITFNYKSYYPDYIIRFPLDDDNSINIDNCDCVFLRSDPDEPGFRKYVGARHFRKSRKEDKIPDSINGYKPEYIFCFTETLFPLSEFIEDQTFDNFQAF